MSQGTEAIIAAVASTVMIPFITAIVLWAVDLDLGAIIAGGIGLFDLLTLPFVIIAVRRRIEGERDAASDPPDQ